MRTSIWNVSLVPASRAPHIPTVSPPGRPAAAPSYQARQNKIIPHLPDFWVSWNW